MKLTFMPKSVLGKCSVILIIVMPIFFYIGMSFVGFYESVPSGSTILSDVINRPGIALFMLSGFVCGITAFFIGIIDIVKKKNYSILVFMSSFVGLFVFYWCIVEVLFPH